MAGSTYSPGMRTPRFAPSGCLLAAFFLSCGLLPSRAGDWQLVWRDEFNRAGAPDPANWTYEEGFVRNQELQFYTRDRRENARVENGLLVIEARHESFPNPAFQQGARDWQRARPNAEFTSACLITRKLHAWKYGRIEVRAKLPQGKGVWPAIWMMGDARGPEAWPACGEIDVMEFVAHDARKIHANVHWAKPGTQREHQSAGGNMTNDTLHSEFHDYGVEWDERTLAITFDGKPYFRFDMDRAGKGTDNPFRQPCYLLINLAVGGTWGREADPAAYPQRFEIDWVRVYRKW